MSPPRLRRGWLVLAWALATGCSSERTSAGPPVATAEPDENARLGARIRRLTTAEYDASVQALLGTKQSLGASFVPDARLFEHAKFERNQAQIVEPMLARQLEQAAGALANEYVYTKLVQAFPCATTGGADCAREFFRSFLPKAYRRQIAERELEDLLKVVVMPALERDGFATAVELGIAAVLQSPGFLYHTELGPEANAKGRFTLTGAEIAQQLAYLITGAPADAELAAAAAVDLELAENRAAHARRLLSTPGARAQVRRLVKQWLDIDQVGNTVKDMTKFPEYQPHTFDRESDAFIDEVVFAQNGDFQLLMAADFTVGNNELAAFYGAPAPSSEPGIIDLSATPRRGILNLGGFLVSYATPFLPSPVRRGARVLTQALCIDPGDPNALNLRVMLPPPNPAKTTRQRFEDHARGACAGCHGMIDSIGFSFEHFNAAGAWEENQDGDPALPIDSATTLQLPSEIPFNGRRVADSAELVELVSRSEAGRRCFARNLARFTAAAHGVAIEQGFVKEWERLAETGQESVQELLVAYVSSTYFVERERGEESANP